MDNIITSDFYEMLNEFHTKVAPGDHDGDNTRVYDSRTGKEMDISYGFHPIEGSYYGDYGYDFFIHQDPTTNKIILLEEDLREHVQPHQMLSEERINEMLTTDEWSMDNYGQVTTTRRNTV